MDDENEYYDGYEEISVERELKKMHSKLRNIDRVSGTVVESGGGENEEEDLIMYLKGLKEENEGLKISLNDLVNTRKAAGGEAQMRKLEEDVYQLRKQFDRCKHEMQNLKKSVRKKEEELKFLRMNTNRKKIFKQKEKQIRVLENRLDKTIIKYNESQMIRETYVKILKRLKRERMGFDNQLRSIEKTLKSKTHDYEELRQMYHEANYLKELSKNQLKDARNEFGEIKKQKMKELEEKKKDVNQRIKLTEKITKREMNRKRIEMRSKGHIDEEEEEKLQKANFLQQIGDLKSDSGLKKKQQLLNHLQGVWRKIKEVTGVNSTKLVIEKFFSSKDTFQNLQKITKNAQERIDKLAGKKNTLKEKLENLKYSQSTTGIGTKRMIDEFIQQLNDSKVLLEKNKKDYERMQNILISVKSGLIHLHEKLSDVFGEEKKIDPEMFTEKDYILELVKNVKDILENKLKVKELIAKPEEEVAEKKMDPVMAEEEDDDEEISSMYQVSKYNVRLNFGKSEEDSDDEYGYDRGDLGSPGFGGGPSSSGIPDDEVDVLDRQQVKKLASLAFEKHKSKTKKK